MEFRIHIACATMKPILVINSGSSTLKFAVFDVENAPERLLIRGTADGVGHGRATLEILDDANHSLFHEVLAFPHQVDALEHVAQRLPQFVSEAIAGIGHRVVHGGPGMQEHREITPSLVGKLQAAVHFAPIHIPESVRLIRYAEKLYPGVRQFACFDTAFHRTLSNQASRYAIPNGFADEGVRRYGFHGISCESIVASLGSKLKSKVVIAHLGNGSSVTAVKDGQSADTSMGLTPTGGIVMGTRTGDLDPGVLLYIQRTRSIDLESLEQLLNKESGLKAIGGDSDMRTLEQRQKDGDAPAQLAIEIFCRGVAKTIASYGAVFGGIEQIVFAGGIGEHSASARARICAYLGFLGVALDAARNQSSEALISSEDSLCQVAIVRTQEELQIARHVRTLLAGTPVT